MDFSSLNLTPGENARGGVPKDLYMCGSLEELEAKVDAEEVQLPTSASVQETQSILNELCLAGILAEMAKDEELAFFNYNRYLTAYIICSQKEDYNADEIMRKIEETVGVVSKTIVTLKQSLTVRYDSLRIQKLQHERKIRQRLEQHVRNLDAYLEASRNLKKAREELGSLRMVQQMVEEDIQQQPQQRIDNTHATIENYVPEQLKCPVCFEIFQEEVFQCMNGHSICSTCYSDPKITACPECRINFLGSVVRNRSVEGLVSTWKMDCPFKERGCKDKILCKQMTAHIETCFFGKSEAERQIIKVKIEIKEKESQASRCEDAYHESYMRRIQTESEWRKMEADNQFGNSILETVVKDLNLREKEEQVLIEIRLNGLQLSLV